MQPTETVTAWRRTKTLSHKFNGDRHLQSFHYLE